MRLPPVFGFMLLVVSIKAVDADDTELFVVTLPDNAQPNVLLILDNSKSMAGTKITNAKSAIVDFLSSASDINITLMSFNWTAPNGGPSGGRIDFASTDIATGRTDAIDVVNNDINTNDNINGTPLTETLYEAYLYFAGLPPKSGYDTSRAEFAGNHSVPDSLTVNSDYYISPIVNACQKNNVLLFTDGEPSGDLRVDTEVHNMISGTTLPSGLSQSCQGTVRGTSTTTSCVDELSWYLANNDVSPSYTDTQTIQTYTIGYQVNTAAENLLISTGNHGGAQYYPASDASELNNALSDILLKVNSQSTTFASPATSVSAFNALETAEDVYYTLFQPDVGPGWGGNLKRFQLGADNQIYDANGNLAIDPLTGFFSSTAQSFWSSNVDGTTVSAGGMAEQITQSRPVYSDIAGSRNVALNNTANALSETNTGITQAMLGAASSSERDSILSWARGVDVDDDNNDGSTTDDRTSIGDSLHTQPEVITYFKNAAGTVVDRTVYFTTNDGFLHAIDSDDGTTEFAYIPQDLLDNLKIYRDGYVDGGTQKVYGMDGSMTAWANDVNGDGDVLQANNGIPDSGEHVYLYLGMRRGGNNIYALDITERNDPYLKWVLRGDLDDDHQADSSATNPDFFELGQTWSAPQIAQVMWNGAEADVLFFGGGYDLDADEQTAIGDNDIGRAVYMVNAESGQLLWSAGHSGADLSLSAMDYSIAADLTLVDIDQDGNIDYIFAADIGGQILRFDINQTNTSAANFATGGVIAKLSGSSSGDARRFFEAPSVTISSDLQHLNISIGSGFRPHPLDTTVNDRVYVIRDKNVFETPASYNYDGTAIITESSLYDATDNLIQQGTTNEQTAALTRLNNSEGWLIQLETPGEKVLSRSKIYRGVLLFTSFAPDSSSSSACGPQQSENYLYAVDIDNAGSVLNLDSIGSSTALVKTDRRQLLKHGSLAPAPSIITRSTQGAEICVGTQCFQGTLQNLGPIPLKRRFWRENR